MIHLKTVQPDQRQLLWNINQKYLYEMTNYYDDPMDEEGNFHYGYFDEYFSDPKRMAYFIYSDDKLCGFAFINPYSFCGQNPDYTMAEFTIFPSFRKQHLASEAVKLIFSEYPGSWEIKYNEKNIPAKKFWHKITAPYHPSLIHLNEVETVLIFTV
jgi:predicted acetyltransferase